ncbi:MAG: DUF669 domain-containing protein [Planctomycetota bacterium]|nr:DUF669 domain-containing protein [Planctomycetota bacterium]
MGKLTDILSAGDGGNIHDLWNSTTAADDFAPLPAGKYVCRLKSGELGTSRSGKPEFTLQFEVLEGDHTGRKVWHSLYLTQAALPMAKRDLGKLGIKSLEQLESPIPKGIRCAVQVARRKSDDGSEHNRVRSFEVLGIDPPEVDPFAPGDTPPNDMPGNTTEAEEAGPAPDSF